jgi:hypothetical protein
MMMMIYFYEGRHKPPTSEGQLNRVLGTQLLTLSTIGSYGFPDCLKLQHHSVMRLATLRVGKILRSKKFL